MAELPDDVRRLISKQTDEVSKAIDDLVAQMDLTDDEEMFAREQCVQVFNLLSAAFIDAYPKVKRARAATAAAVFGFKAVQAWATEDEGTG
jgi:hypothetical protein